VFGDTVVLFTCLCLHLVECRGAGNTTRPVSGYGREISQHVCRRE